MMKTDKLNILYEDNHIIIVIKPADMLSQKDNTGDPDMMSLLKEYLKTKYNKPNEAYLGLVHRLDRRVSGVMVFAKTSKAASRLSAEIRNRNMIKEYRAIVLGIPRESGKLSDYLMKTDEENPKAAVTDSEGKLAELEYQRLKTFRLEGIDFSILSIRLLTGRYQQIRMQLSNFGHPIINDFKYGYREKNFCNQLGLVCTKLSFLHPTKKEWLTFEYFPKEGIWGFL